MFTGQQRGKFAGDKGIIIMEIAIGSDHEAGNIEMVVFTEKTEKATGKK